MKEINTFQLVKVPEGIEASVKSRIVTVKGSRGTLNKDFKHLAVDIYMPDSKTIKVRPVLRIYDPGSEFSELGTCKFYNVYRVSLGAVQGSVGDPDPRIRTWTRIRIRLFLQ
jgi:hypothetical protein